MYYKRFGYKQPSRHDGLGCLTVSAIAFLALCISTIVSVIFQIGWLLFLVIPLSICGFHFSEKYVSKEGSRMKQRRFVYHIGKANDYIENGNEEKALNSIRKAKIYGKVPRHLDQYELFVKHRSN